MTLSQCSWWKGSKVMCTLWGTHPSLTRTIAPRIAGTTKVIDAMAMSTKNATARAMNEASGTPSSSAMRADSCPRYTVSFRAIGDRVAEAQFPAAMYAECALRLQAISRYPREDPLQRRQFLTPSLAASAAALAPRVGTAQTAAPASSSSKPREYYELRKYFLEQGAQSQLTDKYAATALIPALHRMGIGPVSAFNLSIGPETPTLYLLLPCSNLETLVNAELHLRADQEFLAA